MAFEVGQRVVCIADRPTNDDGLPNFVVKGHIYTIRGVGTFKGNHGVWLEELANPKTKGSWGCRERGFGVGRFRPVNESRLDIFRKLLVEPPKETVA